MRLGRSMAFPRIMGYSRQALVSILLMFVLFPAKAGMEYKFDIHDHEFSVEKFVPAKPGGEHLIVWISPGFGDDERIQAVSEKLAQAGVEVWRVDILDNLFKPRSVTAFRELDGKYVAAIINHAHDITGRKVTLMTRAYGALPALRGAREWQQQYKEIAEPYLTGAILFSPEFYSEIPPLGYEPVYHPVTTATNIPIMFYQAGKRGNRWQLDKAIAKLEQGGATVYVKILPGVTGVFYDQDIARETLALLETLPGEILRIIKMLDKLPTPTTALQMREPELKASGLDHSLKLFQGQLTPVPINLVSSKGDRVSVNDFTGKVTIVNFWASWCPPCVKEIPSLNGLRAKMDGKAFDLISVNYAETSEQVRNFMSMVDVDYPVLLDEDGSFTAKWKVLVYPATFIISPDGEIVYGVNGAIEWDSEEVIAALKSLLPN